MNAEQREKEAGELAVLAMSSLRAFLEGKASLHITRQAPLSGSANLPSIGGGLTIVRFVKDVGQ